MTGNLEAIQKQLGLCTRCQLHQGRKNIVFGVGNPKADLVIVGEAPGRDEDAQGEPFVGQAGKLLDNMLEYYKSKQLAVAINTGNQPRTSVSTQTSVLDTIRLLQQQFESFQYGRNTTNTFLGIATVQATLCLLNMLRTEIGVPAQYEKPEEFVPAAYCGAAPS